MSFLSLNQLKECPVSAVGGIEAAQAVIAWSNNETLQHRFWVDAGGNKKYILSRFIGYEYIDMNELKIIVANQTGGLSSRQKESN